ncbi:hypothetical protein GGU10DRAFT_381174 [Lentinula aff. detonsa]|uniref:Uncharacterized protein n=1 Tax=Lentinula aff. detonsa TaxID=2804958 RepID=A0AA38NIN8_9AGAR|nr:hypothetical protein GGU10DRAFT_381174 [Lentinula aff. detonsa]
MADVFGTDMSGEDVKAWTKYWTELEVYEEKLHEGIEDAQIPLMPTSIDNSNAVMEPQVEVIELLNAALQDTTMDREREHWDRKENGNNAPRLAQVQKVGKKPNKLCVQLAIECSAKDQSGKVTRVYYCIGCDEKRSNNALDRALPHALNCDKLQREWPMLYQKAREEALNRSGVKTITGQSQPQKVRTKKRKIEDESEGRVPVFFTSSEATPSSLTELGTSRISQPQPTLEASWGETSQITAPRQAQIDYFLLRFIICLLSLVIEHSL